MNSGETQSCDAGRLQTCREIVRKCHSQFDAPTLTSDELLRMDTSELMIVDVRTVPERLVSRIPGSISLTECYDKLRQSPSATIVLYCTVGYRSGLEAVHIQHLYPDATVLNLDGILAYSHAVCAEGRASRFQEIHTFGEAWDLAPSNVPTTHFRGIVLTCRLAQVAWTSFSRRAERWMKAWLLCLCIGTEHRCTAGKRCPQFTKSQPQELET